DDPNRGCPDPSDLLITPNNKRAFVTVSGADEVLILDLSQFHKLLSDRKRDVELTRILNLFREDKSEIEKAVTAASEFDLTAARRFVIARLPTQSNPRRLALSGDGKTLVVSNYLSDSLTVIDAVNLKVVRHIPLGGPKPDAARRGEILF